MKLQSRAIVLNTVLVLTLAALTRFHPTSVVAASAAILLPFANFMLFLRARRERHRGVPLQVALGSAAAGPLFPWGAAPAASDCRRDTPPQ